MQTTPAEQVAARPDEGRRFSLWLLLAGVLVVVLALGANIIVLRRQTSGDAVQAFVREEEPRVKEQATKLLSLLMNYSGADVSTIGDRILALSTGNFRQQYEQVLGRGLSRALQQAGASSRGQIVTGPNVSFRSATEAIAISRVEQTTQSNQNPRGRTFVYLLEVTLVNTADEQWKADRIEILSVTQGRRP